MREIVRKRILAKCKNKCVDCGSTDSLEVDHIIPLCCGGRHDEDNFQILCKTCNLKKSRKVNLDKYFKLGDGKNYLYLSRNIPPSILGSKQFLKILEMKFVELCPKYGGEHAI